MTRYPLPLAPSLRCPACGRQATLFIGIGGYPTCSSRECPEPDAATTLLSSTPVEPRSACGHCGERLAAHDSHLPGLFRCADGVDTPWSEFHAIPSIPPEATS